MDMLNDRKNHLLTINAGSSSIKFSVFLTDGSLTKVLDAVIENIGEDTAEIISGDEKISVAASDHVVAADIFVKWLTTKLHLDSITAIGHRIVHGGPNYYTAQPVTDKLVRELHDIIPFDLEHLPTELQLIRTFEHLLPHTKQIACFDTAFHHDLPAPARLLPIPRRFEALGIRRYGFHGLSYAYILQELRRVEGDAAANGKVIIAHLGSGASLAALRDGKPIDTTMGMTPASGIPMSTRAGDLDSGLALYFSRTQGYDAEHFNYMVNFESGLLGISETSGDMKKLLNIEAEDDRAKDAIDLFCYQTKKSIGGMAAGLGGLNTLVFTGGMGENAPKIRKRICENLEFLGIRLDDERNDEGRRLISADGSLVGVHVIHTDEATTIARETAECLKHLEG